MKNFKRILAILLVLALGVCMIVGMTSCTEPETDPCTTHVDNDSNGKCDNCDEPVEPQGDGKVDYVVTVKDEDGNAVGGATVVIYLNGLSERGENVTDAEGKVTFRLKEGNYSAAVVDAPAEYTFDEEMVALTNNAATITVEKLPAYTIYVVDANGQAVSGVEVQLCSTDDRCLTPQLTDESGRVVYYAVEDSYKAKVTDSYAKEHGHSNYDYKLLADGQVTLTLQAQ